MRGPERADAEQRRYSRSRETPGGEPEAVRIWLLGGFRVSVGSRMIGEEEWRLKKASSLIKLLALAPGYRMHRERAMELLWPGLGPEAALNNLHYALHVVRRTLEPALTNAASHCLTLRGDLLALCPDGPVWVDVEAFEGAAATARRSREPAAYRAAAELYGGDLLPGDLYEEWAEERREGLKRSYNALLLELAVLYEEREEYGAAIEALRRAAAEEPTQEEAYTGLMRLYALSGRHHEAILQYERLQKALRERLDEEPGEASRRLYEEIRAGRFPSAPPPSPTATGRPSEGLSDPSPNNLPASLTSFVGREDALLEVKRLLWMTRLLTLTGAGGSGKTRLALEVARDLVGAYPQGVWLVELAPLADPELAPQLVAKALAVREQPGRLLEDTLADHLRRKDLLLVLDNCEHLVDAVARLAHALLRSCPRLRVLATSREPLGVPGEALWGMPPLSLPDMQGATSIQTLMSAEAVRLFLDRARLRLLHFELSEENAGAVGRICRKLEGIPLAIELAAARMGALALEQVAQRLEDSLKLLTGGGRTVEPRQQTMRATLEWSHELLSEPERVLFGRLSVFAEGWTLEAAQEVCSSGEGIGRDEVVKLLSKLVDKSLVMAEAGAEGEPRYRMLEPIRQYGRERLEESGTAERVRERHAAYYLGLAEGKGADRADPGVWGVSPVWWLERMETEHANLRAALDWSLDEDAEPDGRAELGLRLAVVLILFWYTQGSLIEGRRYLERALSGRSSDPTTPRLRAPALEGAGGIALFQGDYEAAKALVEEGLALYRELGDKEGIASALTELGLIAVVGQRDDIPLSALLEELGELKPRLKNRNTLAYLLILEGTVAMSRGDLEHSVTLHEESLELFREIGNKSGILTCLVQLGYIALIRADYEGAASLLREALRAGWELDFKPAIQTSLHGLACVAADRHQPVRAARLWGAVEGMREAYGVHLTALGVSVSNYEGRLAAARSQLGDEEAWSAAWAEGKAMSLEQAIEYACSEEEERQPPPPTLVAVAEQRPPADERASILTRREREVAILVARGLTNRRIASELSISERTVENHVGKILKKLGFSSRAKIAAWVAQL